MVQLEKIGFIQPNESSSVDASKKYSILNTSLFPASISFVPFSAV